MFESKLFIFLDLRIRYYVYYQYDKVKLPKEKVTSGSAFVLTPLPSRSSVKVPVNRKCMGF